jgi:hypothetical protein
MISNLPMKTALALTLVISATAATAASARPNLKPIPAGQSQVASPRPGVHANPDEQGPQTDEAGIPPILRRATPSQRPAIRQAQQREAQRLAYSQPKNAKYSNAETNAYANYTTTSAPRTVRIVSHNGGFDWGDAGVGAAGGLGLAILGVGGAFAVSQQRRTRRSKGSAAITS